MYLLRTTSWWSDRTSTSFCRNMPQSKAYAARNDTVDAGEPSEGTAGHATHPTAGVAAALVLLVIGISTVSPRPARAALAAREADAAEKRAAVCAAVVVSRGGVVTAVAMQGGADAALHSLLQEPGVESAFVVEEAPPCSPST